MGPNLLGMTLGNFLCFLISPSLGVLLCGGDNRSTVFRRKLFGGL